MILTPRIVEAVGFAHTPGRNTIKKDAKRFVHRRLIHLLHSSGVPRSQHERILRWALILMPLRGASKGDTYENDLLKLLFNATAIANVADNAASSPLTNLSVALHTADPGESGTQASSEIAYTSYARVSVVRTSGGWTVTGNSVSPAAAITFPAGTGGSGTASYFSVGPTGGGSTKIFYSGTISPNIVCGNGITPSLSTSSTITED